ncbi:MAG: hypothetical protein ACRDQB_05960 [Thermocrispum sp.]
MTSGGGTAGKGYEIDPDKMRSALKLAQSMLEELEERGHEVPDLVGVVAPAGDPESLEYTNGQQVGARTPAVTAMQGYGDAYTAQVTFLSQLIPNLQSALASYESTEQSVADSANSTQSQL